MPRFHDPALCTPERCRAVAALHWFGVVQLLFAAVFLFVMTFGILPDVNIAGFHFLVAFVPIAVVIVLLPGALGIMAIAAATGVCRRRRWGLWMGEEMTAIAALYFLVAWCVFLFTFLPFFFLFTFYLCVGSVLCASANSRLARFRKTNSH